MTDLRVSIGIIASSGNVDKIIVAQHSRVVGDGLGKGGILDGTCELDVIATHGVAFDHQEGGGGQKGKGQLHLEGRIE